MQTPSLVLRPVEASDVERLGEICYEGFRDISTRHGFPPDMPSIDVGKFVIGLLFGSPGFYGVAAVSDGQLVGSNWLDERNAISGIGPITVDPNGQNAGVGRRLMEAVIERSDARGFLGVRLVQAAYHMRSLSLYTKLGFESREQLAVMSGVPSDPAVNRFTVRALSEADIVSCNALCAAVHGFHRGGEVEQAAAAGHGAFVAERDGAIRAYTSGLGYFGHTVGESNDAIAALLAKAPHLPSLGPLIPIRNHPLFRWCLDHGMRAVQTMTLMSRGIYQEPRGPYLPSITY